MRISKDRAAANRRAIIVAAGKLFREQGYEAVGLNDLMKAAGFTRGGFYNHFASKDELAVEVCKEIYEENSRRLVEIFSTAKDDNMALVQVLESFLSTSHRDTPATGCPSITLVTDAIRQGESVQKAFADGLQQYVDIFAAQFVRIGAPKTEARSYAIDLLARIVGAMTLARAVVKHDTAFSDEILGVTLAGVADLAQQQTPVPTV